MNIGCLRAENGANFCSVPCSENSKQAFDRPPPCPQFEKDRLGAYLSLNMSCQMHSSRSVGCFPVNEVPVHVKIRQCFVMWSEQSDLDNTVTECLSEFRVCKLKTPVVRIVRPETFSVFSELTNSTRYFWQLAETLLTFSMEVSNALFQTLFSSLHFSEITHCKLVGFGAPSVGKSAITTQFV